MHDEDDRPPLAVRRLQAIRETRALLARADQAWNRFSCPATAECCQLAMTSRPPWLWPSEWALLRDHLTRKQRPFPAPRADGGCPLLDEAGQRCTVYEARPFGCRTFFCHRVKGPASHPTQTTNDLLQALAAANLAWLDGAAPRPLPELIAEAQSGAS